MEPMPLVDPNHIHLVRVRLYKSNIEVNHKDEGLIQRIHHYSFSFNQKSYFDVEKKLVLLN